MLHTSFKDRGKTAAVKSLKIYIEVSAIILPCFSFASFVVYFFVEKGRCCCLSFTSREARSSSHKIFQATLPGRGSCWRRAVQFFGSYQIPLTPRRHLTEYVLLIVSNVLFVSVLPAEVFLCYCCCRC